MSTANPAEIPASDVSTPRPFSSLPKNIWLRLFLALVVLAVGAGVGYVASREYPDGAPPKGSDLEATIAGVFGVPNDKIDASIIGDLLIERFYVIDQDTGDRYVGDLLKGRIQSVQTNLVNGQPAYTLILDLRNFNRDRALFAAFVEDVARPRQVGVGEYLGLRAPLGLNDAFQLNYTGFLPERRLPFRSQDGESLQEFLVSRRFAQVSASAELIGVEGYNYLLSNTELFPYFRGEFTIGKAIFVSELLIVDTTAPEQQRLYYQLTQKYPRPPR